MKECNFCEHRKYDSNGEPFCIKRLFYLENCEPIGQCSDFTIPFGSITLAIVAVKVLVMLFIILLCGA